MIEEIDKLQDIIDKGRSLGTIDDEIGKELLKLSNEILDKHINQPDYKSAWNELKEIIWKLVDEEKREDKFWAKRELKDNIDNSMQELEQKYNLGGDNK